MATRIRGSPRGTLIAKRLRPLRGSGGGTRTHNLLLTLILLFPKGVDYIIIPTKNSRRMFWYLVSTALPLLSKDSRKCRVPTVLPFRQLAGRVSPLSQNVRSAFRQKAAYANPSTSLRVNFVDREPLYH